MPGNDIEIRIRVNDDGTGAAFRRVRSEARGLDSDTARLGANLGILPFSIGQFASVGVPAIGLVGQAAAAAGPLILALGAAAGSVMLGMDGIKAAAETIKPAFESMKTAVSDVFEKQLTPVMKNLADNVFPTLTTGMEDMALSLSSVASDMVGFLASEAGVAKLKDTLGGATMFINGMRPGLTAALDMLLTMGQAAAPSMEKLGAAFGSIFTSLNTEIQGLVSSGVFQQAIDGFASTVTGLGSVFAQVFGAIVTMGAGLGDSLGNGLRLVGDIIGAITPILGVMSQAFGVMLNAIVTAATPVVAALTPIIELIAGALSDAIVTLTPAIQAIAQAFGGALATAITALKPAFDAMVPVIGVLAQILSTVLTTALQALQPLFAAIGPIAKTFADALVQLMPAVQAIAVALGGAIVQAIQSMAPVFQQLADAAIQLAPVIADLAVQFGQALAAAITAIAPLIPVIVQAFMDILAAIIPLIPKFVELAQKVLPLIPPVIQGIVDAINFLVPIIATIIGVLADVIVAIIDFCINADRKWVEFTSATAKAWEDIKAAPGKAIDAAVQYVTSTVAGWLASISRQWEQFKTDTKKKFDDAVKAVQAAFKIDWGAVGRAVIDGIISGVSSGTGRLAAAARDAAQSAFRAAKNFLGIASPSALFRDEVGKQITAGMVVGIDRTAGNVARAASGAARGMFAGLGDVVKDGSVDEATWQRLRAAGWKGRAGDGMEALYRPSGGGMGSGGTGGRAVTVTFAGNTSDALATVIMAMIRTGKIQIA